MRGNLPKFGREEGKNKIILLFKKRTEEGKTPTKEFIEKKLHISLYTYFPRGIKELYKITGINLLPKLRDREGLKCEIISYVKSQVKKGHYPTYEETNEKFNTNLNKLFSNIFELYKLANIVYKREPNPFIKYKKEEKLAQICKKIFQKKGYKIKDVSIGPSTKGGADIVLLNKNKELVPIELKAYHKYGRVGTNKNCPSNYFGNEIKQLREYIKRLKSPYGYLITTTSRVCKKPSSIVKILVYEDLKELLIRYNFTGELENLEWIRNTHPSGNKELMIKSIRREIVSYIQKEFKKGNYVSSKEIAKKFKINLRTYFESMKDLYIISGIDPNSLSHARMGGQINKSIIKERIINYMKNECKKGYCPTHKDIQKRFRCLVKCYFPEGIRQIMGEAGITYQRKFANKTKEEKEKIRKQIIDYTNNRYQKGYKVTYRELTSQFKINLYSYFEDMETIRRSVDGN